MLVGTVFDEQGSFFRRMSPGCSPLSSITCNTVFDDEVKTAALWHNVMLKVATRINCNSL